MTDYLCSRRIALLALLIIVMSSGVVAAADGMATPFRPGEITVPPQCYYDQMLAPRPFELGISGGNVRSVNRTKRYVDCCEGTLGSLVQDTNGTQYLLSNNHVLARQSTRDGRAKIGEAIIQPGLIYNGCAPEPNSVVANLSAWTPITMTKGARNVDDAAIAKVVSGQVDPAGQIWNIGPIAPEFVPSASVALNLVVQKQGRTSCWSSGIVEGIDATIVVRYLKECGSIKAGMARFVDQIVLAPFEESDFSYPGDSGSLIVTQDACPRAVGLLFAGGTENGENITIANPIESVLNALNVTMVGTCTPGSTASLPLAQNSAASSVQSGSPPDDEYVRRVANVKSVKDRHEDDLMSIPGVVGVAVGTDNSAGEPTIHIYVSKDTPQMRDRFPTQLEGVPVTFRQTGEIQAY
jgi:hypothetical protein